MKARLLLTALVLAIAGTSSAAHANYLDYDHLKCFKIRDSLVDRRTIYLADIFPESPFAAQSDCRLRLPARHFCVNVAKENVQVNGEPFDTIPVMAKPGRDYLCYGLKCDRDRLDVDALDQFGARPLRVRKSDFLCMPANKILPNTSPTPPPTATPAPTETPTPVPTATPLPPRPCQLLPGNNFDGVCDGDCPPGEKCATLGMTGARVDDCRCVPDDQMCGDRPISTGNPLPMCGGFCVSPYEICTSDLSDVPEGGGGRGVFCRCFPLILNP